MLSIHTIARVEVNAVRSASQPTSFDTGLLLVKDSSFAADKRLRSYAGSAEAAAGLAAAGFSSSTEAYRAAQKYFAASPASSRLLVSCYPASESPSDALDEVLDRTSDFYGIALADTRTDAEVLALETHIAGMDKPAMLFQIPPVVSKILPLSMSVLFRFCLQFCQQFTDAQPGCFRSLVSCFFG